MKKSYHKLLTAILSLAMMLSLLAGCGGGSAGSSGDAGKSGGSAGVPSGEVITWRLQSNYALDSLEGDMAKNLKKVVETVTNGRLQIELYEPGALCQASDKIGRAHV